MSNYSLQADDPERIKFTLTMTMTLGDWMEIQKAIKEVRSGDFWPYSEMCCAIDDMVSKATNNIWPSYSKLPAGPDE